MRALGRAFFEIVLSYALAFSIALQPFLALRTSADTTTPAQNTIESFTIAERTELNLRMDLIAYGVQEISVEGGGVALNGVQSTTLIPDDRTIAFNARQFGMPVITSSQLLQRALALPNVDETVPAGYRLTADSQTSAQLLRSIQDNPLRFEEGQTLNVRHYNQQKAAQIAAGIPQAPVAFDPTERDLANLARFNDPDFARQFELGNPVRMFGQEVIKPRYMWSLSRTRFLYHTTMQVAIHAAILHFAGPVAFTIGLSIGLMSMGFMLWNKEVTDWFIANEYLPAPMRRLAQRFMGRNTRTENPIPTILNGLQSQITVNPNSPAIRRLGYGSAQQFAALSAPSQETLAYGQALEGASLMKADRNGQFFIKLTGQEETMDSSIRFYTKFTIMEFLFLLPAKIALLGSAAVVDYYNDITGYAAAMLESGQAYMTQWAMTNFSWNGTIEDFTVGVLLSTILQSSYDYPNKLSFINEAGDASQGVLGRIDRLRISHAEKDRLKALAEMYFHRRSLLISVLAVTLAVPAITMGTMEAKIALAGLGLFGIATAITIRMGKFEAVKNALRAAFAPLTRLGRAPTPQERARALNNAINNVTADRSMDWAEGSSSQSETRRPPAFFDISGALQSARDTLTRGRNFCVRYFWPF